MFSTFSNWQSGITATRLAVYTALAFVFNLVVSYWLNSSYAESRFPVPYFEAQLSFDHLKLKNWYGFLIEKGTLQTYIQTQHIDFLFIASTVLLHLFALLLLSRLFSEKTTWRRLMVVSALIAMVAPLADAIENFISYVMLANPLAFPAPLAIVYSSFSALKFAMFTFAYLVAIAALLLFFYQWGAKKISKQAKSA
jgi:hypothetical protein